MNQISTRRQLDGVAVWVSHRGRHGRASPRKDFVKIHRAHWLICAQVFLTDSDDEIRRKIMTHAFSGGRETAKLQRELGADLDIDVAYQWLRFFLEDDEELEAIGKSYGSGQGAFWNTAAVKERLVVELQKLVRAHKARRDVLTDSDVDAWMAVRALGAPY